MARSLRGMALLAALFTFVLGCGGSSKYSASITGKVAYKGAPVTGGFLKLTNPEEADFSVGIGADGYYLVEGIAPGTYTVYVDTESLNPKNAAPEYTPSNIAKAGGGGASKMAPKGMPMGPMPGKGGGSPNIPGQSGGQPKGPVEKGLGAAPPPKDVTPGAKGTYVKVPDKYRTTGKSDITVTVKSGANTFDVELKD